MKSHYVVLSKKIIEEVNFICKCGTLNSVEKTKNPQSFDCKVCKEPNILVKETMDVAKLGKEAE